MGGTLNIQNLIQNGSNLRTKTIKLLERNTGKNVHDTQKSKKRQITGLKKN